MRLLVIGFGRMGKLVDQLSESYGFEVAAGSTSTTTAAVPALPLSGCATSMWPSTSPPATPWSTPCPVWRSTGSMSWWVPPGGGPRSVPCRKTVEDAGSALLRPPISPSGSTCSWTWRRARQGCSSTARLRRLIHEVHHAAKIDAPSGTALALQQEMAQNGYARPIDMASTRVGAAPGTHTVGFDGPSETIALTHTTRDRATFARGALEAARWVQGRHGWFSMRDVLGLVSEAAPRADK